LAAFGFHNQIDKDTSCAMPLFGDTSSKITEPKIVYLT
jgi:hypothetical protein